MSAAEMEKPVLTVEDLSVSFRRRIKQREIITNVVEGMSFDLHAGETLALVGESGSGKSLTALSLLQLLPYPHAFHPSGSIRYHGVELVNADAHTLQRIRGNDISMILPGADDRAQPAAWDRKTDRRIPRPAPGHQR